MRINKERYHYSPLLACNKTTNQDARRASLQVPFPSAEMTLMCHSPPQRGSYTTAATTQTAQESIAHVGPATPPTSRLLRYIRQFRGPRERWRPKSCQLQSSVLAIIVPRVSSPPQSPPSCDVYTNHCAHQPLFGAWHFLRFL